MIPSSPTRYQGSPSTRASDWRDERQGAGMVGGPGDSALVQSTRYQPTSMPSCTSSFIRLALRLANRYAWCGRAHRHVNPRGPGESRYRRGCPAAAWSSKLLQPDHLSSSRTTDEQKGTERRLVQTLGGQVCAVLSARYLRIDHHEVAEVAPTVLRQGLGYARHHRCTLRQRRERWKVEQKHICIAFWCQH